MTPSRRCPQINLYTVAQRARPMGPRHVGSDSTWREFFAVDVNRPLIEPRVNTAKAIRVLMCGVKWGNFGCMSKDVSCPQSLSSVQCPNWNSFAICLLALWTSDYLAHDLNWIRVDCTTSPVENFFSACVKLRQGYVLWEMSPEPPST